MKDRQRVFQIEYKGHTHAFQSRDVDMIVGARIEEIFSRVRQELLSIGKSNNLSAGVILCGGGSNLKDIDLAVSRILQLPVKICDMSSYKTPNLVPLDIEWATAVGLILFDDTSIGLGSSQINNNTKNIKHAKKVISNFSKLISFRSKNKK
jgi:cell division ATPase FtsA